MVRYKEIPVEIWLPKSQVKIDENKVSRFIFEAKVEELKSKYSGSDYIIRADVKIY